MVVDGLVWSPDIASAWQRSKGTLTGRDPHTGEVKAEFGPDVDPHAIMHQRCYPSKGTDRFIITSWIGTEFIEAGAAGDVPSLLQLRLAGRPADRGNGVAQGGRQGQFACVG